MKLSYFFLFNLIVLLSFSCSNNTKTLNYKSNTVLESKKTLTAQNKGKNDFTKEIIEYELEKDSFIFYKTDTIRIESLRRGSNTWKGAFGGIKVTLKDKSDTIFDGSYGLVPNYELVPSIYGLRLLTRATQNGGGNNYESLSILDLNYESFLDTIYNETINVGTEKRVDSSYWLFCSKKLIFSYTSKEATIQLDSTYYKMDESQEYSLETLSQGRRKKQIDLK